MKPHLSADAISQWIAGERTLEAERHLEECSECAAEVRETEDTLVLFRESGRRWSDHWYRQRETRARGIEVRFVPAMAACAVLCAALFLVLRSPAPAVHVATAEAPFLAMPFVAPLAPYERAEVVRMDLPVAELIAAGIEVDVPDTGATVLADVVIGQDGRMHAVRLVSDKGRLTP